MKSPNPLQAKGARGAGLPEGFGLGMVVKSPCPFHNSAAHIGGFTPALTAECFPSFRQAIFQARDYVFQGRRKRCVSSGLAERLSQI